MNRMEREEFLVQKYAKLGPKKCAEELGATLLAVYAQAHRLRKNGRISRLKNTGPKGKKEQVVETIKKAYGIKSTKDLAAQLKLTPGYINHAASAMGIAFYGHQGGLNIEQLAKLLGSYSPRVANWVKCGELKVKYKVNSRGPHQVSIVDISDFKKFLRKRPEILAEIFQGISPENKVILELDDFKIPSFREKLVRCGHCEKDFWIEISLANPRCSQCGRVVSKYGLEYK